MKSAKPKKAEEKEAVGAEPAPKAKPKKAAAKAPSDAGAKDTDAASPRKGKTVPKVPRKK
ncbi:hypothetical protein D3C72_2587820 [compost metagenome]